MTRHLYRFGSFRLDTAARELWDGPQRLTLPSSAFDCLAYLVEHRDRAVGRDELIAAIWGRADVTDTQLGQAIVRVRGALGDTGREQQFVRTVPRFGYRFIAETALDEAPPETAPSFGAPASSPSPSVAAEPAQPETGTRARPILAALAVLALIAIATLWGLYSARDARTPGAAPPAAGEPALPVIASAAPAVVWPATVSASGEWAWLRLGIMDLVATRLRSAGVSTMPSDNVVGLLRAQNEQGLAAGPDLVPEGALRIEPQVEQDGAKWRVRLHATGAGHDLLAFGESGDVLDAARGAADALLIKLGRAPPPGGDAPQWALEELIRRVNAASLSGQNALAANLIEQASPELQAQPEVGWALANIELRAGRYGDAQQRLLGLLDRVSADDAPLLRGRILNTLAAIHVRRDEPGAAREAYTEAEELLRGRDDSPLGLAHLGLGLTDAMEERFDPAIIHLGRARTLFEGAGHLLGVGHVDSNLASIDLLRHRPADAVPRLVDVERRFARLGAQEELAHTRIMLARAYLQLLNYEEAQAAIERVWPVETQVANERLRWQAVAVRAQVLVERGHLAEAESLLSGLHEKADSMQDAAALAIGQALSAKISAGRGQPDEEVAQLAQAALVPALEHYANDRRLYALTWMLRLHALRRSGTATTEETGRLIEWLQAQPDDWRLAWIEYVLAGQAWHDGLRDDALRHYQTAFERIERFGIPEDTVAIAQPYVLALIDAGQIDRASAVAGRLANWGEHDHRVAMVQARIYRSMNRPAAARQSTERALQLAGERILPREP